MLDSEPFPAYAEEYSRLHGYEEDDDADEGHEAASTDTVEEIHEAAATLLLVLAALHVGGVALETRLSGRGLVRAMIWGRRN